jgi:hypothetical protein
MIASPRLPYAIILGIAITAAVFGLFAITIGAGIWTFVLFVIVVIVLCFIGVALYRFFIDAWLKWAGMKFKQIDAQNQHERLMIELKYKYVAQLPAPQSQSPRTVDEKYTDPARDVALRLLSATIESTDKKYGPKGTQVMTQADAGAIGIIANDWSAAVAYLCSNYDVLTIDGKGTYTTKNKTISRVMADTAVMQLTGVTR